MACGSINLLRAHSRGTGIGSALGPAALLSISLAESA
jgi:hypothetical protein